jgi:thioredoxin-related protein
MLEVDVDNQREVAAEYSVTAMPTLIFFQNKKELKRIRGADSNGIVQAVQELASKNPQAVRRGSTAADGSSGSSGTSSSNIKSMAKEVSNYIAKGFEIINDIIHFGDAEILNVETASSSDTLRGLFDLSEPKQVFSDADSQMLLYIPLQNKAKVHSIYIKSKKSENDKQRVSHIKVWANTPGMISFDDAASDTKALHDEQFNETNYDENGWIEIKLRYVLFQSVNSLVLFLEGEDEDEPTVIDSIVICGSKGESREQAKLEKIDHE